jgi:ABC-type bacteriocin/lantibiotic exporter with double-glycine peptidase domain
MKYQLMIKILMLFFVLRISFFANAEESDSIQNIPDESWNWMPVWRDQADCGPNALYVLMKLEKYNVTIEHVKKLIPLDPIKGCSMESLIDASKKLGFPIEAKFVKPGNLSKIPRHFILHGITSQTKNLGHFLVIADFDKKKKHYALIDSFRETYAWNPEAFVLYGYSGYILIPRYSNSWKWNVVSGVTLIVCGVGIFIIICRKKVKK